MNFKTLSLRVALILILGSLFISTGLAGQKVSVEKILRYREKVAGHTIEVVIYQSEFDFSPYKLTGGTLHSDSVAKINGVNIAGTDGNSPKKSPSWPRMETISRIELIWDGKKIPVPKLLHINLLRLSLEPDGSIQFVPHPSGEALLIQATGGDGGASYLVSLVLRKNGHHKQYEAGYCESGLRPYPYMIEEIVGEKDGNSIVKSFPWLPPKNEQNDAEKPTSR